LRRRRRVSFLETASMLSRETVERLILEGKCVFHTTPLAHDEQVISRKGFPFLYRGESNECEIRQIANILKLIPELLRSDNSTLKERVQGFMQLVLRNGNILNEDFLHRYLFEFWNELQHGNLGQVELLEKYFKGTPDGTDSDFHKRFVAKVVSGNEHIPDIIGYSTNWGGTAYIIEIKKEMIDDRALGQILRYYHRARSAADRNFFGPPIYRVVPVLVSAKGDLSIWDAVPYYFKEIVEILYWRMDHAGRLRLIDGKASLRVASSERIWNGL
jgi:hypothetical protein